MAPASTPTPILTQNVGQLHVMIHEQQDTITILKEQLYLSLHRQYGRSADVVDLDQGALFHSDDVELLPLDDSTPDPIPLTQDPANKTRSRQGLRVNKDLPVERVDIELPAEEQVCGDCGGDLHSIGTEVSTRLEYVPAQLIRKELHRHKYACRGCEGGIKRADLPATPIPKSQASASLLAFLITAKFVDHLPLHRIERQLARLGLILPRSTQGDWVMACGELTAKLLALMARDVRDRGHLFSDDTTLPLQNDIPGRKQTLKSRLWVYRTDQTRGPPIIVYDFTRGREKAGPARFLKHFRGYLQADAYGGYKHLYQGGDIHEVACWAHARRKFVEACDLTTTPGRAHYAVKVIKQLYRIERECADAGLTLDDRKAYRQEHALPVLDHFKDWLDEQANAVLPKGTLSKAITYALNQWGGLTRYLDEGYLNIDNNWAEQSMRPIALGRKNYLFVGSERSGSTAANLYSLVETCKANDINPQSYLATVLDQLPAAKSDEELKQLLPYADGMAERFPMAKR